MNKLQLASHLDLANHHANATHKDIQTICTAVAHYHFNSAFVNPYYVAYAKDQLQGKGKVGTVVAFPLGQEILEVKVLTAQKAAQAGADELDVMLNVGMIKEAKWHDVLDEMHSIIDAARTINQHIIVKFIPETGYLTEFEIKKMAELMVQTGADFFKTCSGMGPRNATLEDVRLVRTAVGDAIKVKVAGGVSDYAQAIEFLTHGADRIGTSHAVEIIKEV
jgi:deoxyribose-phosphate aldolase